MITTQPIVDSIKKELGSLFSTQAHNDDNIVRYINSAVNYIWNYKDWSFTKTTQTVNVTVPMATNTIDFVTPVYSVRIGTLYPEILDMKNWFKTPNPINQVACYEDVFIAPLTGSYEILYRTVAPRITSFTDLINLPERFTDVVRILAVMYGYKDIKQYEKSSAILGEANAYLDKVADRLTVNAPSQLARLGESTNWY